MRIPGKHRRGTHGDTSFSSSVPRLDIDNQQFTYAGDTWDAYSTSLAYAGERSVLSPIYIRSWENSVPSVPNPCKSLMLYSETGDGTFFLSVPKCPPQRFGRVW